MELKLHITVKLVGVLERGRFREKRLDFVKGVVVADVINSLHLPAEHVDIILINGKHVKTNQVLAEGDVLTVMPMVEGG